MLATETVPAADDPWLGCNPFDPAFRDDPYPSLARLREIDPVNEMPVGIWRLTRYADVNRLLHDVPAGVRTTDGVLPGVDESLTGQRLFMLQQDPPTHTRLRRLVSSAFTPRAIAALRPQIQRIVDGCLARVAARGAMDVIADLALPVPATVICEMLGVPVADRDRLTGGTSKATDECLRFDGPIILTPRVLHADVEFGRKTLPKDAKVWGMLAAADRDPAVFPEPDRFDIARRPNDHLAFGGGPHFCLGAHLAKLEGEIAIASLVVRFADLRLVSETVEWGASLFRVPGKLPITFRAH